MLTLFEHFPSLICEAGTINLVKCGTGLIYEIFQFFPVLQNTVLNHVYTQSGRSGSHVSNLIGNNRLTFNLVPGYSGILCQGNQIVLSAIP